LFFQNNLLRFKDSFSIGSKSSSRPVESLFSWIDLTFLLFLKNLSPLFLKQSIMSAVSFTSSSKGEASNKQVKLEVKLCFEFSGYFIFMFIDALLLFAERIKSELDFFLCCLKSENLIFSLCSFLIFKFSKEIWFILDLSNSNDLRPLMSVWMCSLFFDDLELELFLREST